MPSSAIISSLTPPAPNAVRVAADRKDTPAFSYDDAVSALERASSRALDIHGATPSQPVTQARPKAAHHAGAQRTVDQPQPAEATPARQGAASQPELAIAARRQTPASPSTPLSVAVATVATSANTPAPAQPVLQATSTVTPLRETSARPRSEAVSPAIIVRAPAQALKQFAEILARRLENASQFDLRLDPQALGSIDGRLILSDDGQAVLALAFDNQAAFDLFRRDEAALRQALASAGFDLSGQDLQFAFREPSQQSAQSLRHDASVLAAAPIFVSPSPLHRGAIDIRA